MRVSFSFVLCSGLPPLPHFSVGSCCLVRLDESLSSSSSHLFCASLPSPPFLHLSSESPVPPTCSRHPSTVVASGLQLYNTFKLKVFHQEANLGCSYANGSLLSVSCGLSVGFSSFHQGCICWSARIVSQRSWQSSFLLTSGSIRGRTRRVQVE